MAFAAPYLSNFVIPSERGGAIATERESRDTRFAGPKPPRFAYDKPNFTFANFRLMAEWDSPSWLSCSPVYFHYAGPPHGKDTGKVILS